MALGAPVAFQTDHTLPSENSGARETPQPWGWAVLDSNQWPPACKAGALPTELTARCSQGNDLGRHPPRVEGRRDRAAVRDSTCVEFLQEEVT